LDDSKLAAPHPWSSSASTPGYFEYGYLHDGNQDKGSADLDYVLKAQKGGSHEVRISYTKNNNRASNVPVTVTASFGSKTIKVNQKKAPGVDGTWHSLGKFNLKAGETVKVTIATKGTDGYVIADAVQLLPID